jgi:hypothetical protein
MVFQVIKNYQPVPPTQPNNQGFAIPNMGGDMAVRYGQYVWADGTAGTVMRLPQGAVPLRFEINVAQSFDGGTQTMRLGDTSTSNRWASVLDVGTAAFVTTGLVGSAMGPVAGSLTEDTYVVIARNNTAGGSATQGTLSVVCYYAMI